MIAKIIDRQKGTEKILDNIIEMEKEVITEKKAKDALGMMHHILSHEFGNNPSLFKHDNLDKPCTFIDIQRRDPISQSGYAQYIVIYHSNDDDHRTSLFVMNDKGVTIDRMDV